MKHALLLLALSLLTACGPSFRDTNVPISAQADFDVTQYLGTWYEIARYPVSVQQGCTATTATYGALDATRITVVNQCRQGAPSGALREVRGTADLVGPGQLRVQFNNVPLVRGAYWVLWVDEGYDTAVVGVPNGRAGWILARQPHIRPKTRARAEDILQRNGYDPSGLIDVPHAAP